MRQVDADRARARTLADDQIELKILHRRIEDLLDRRRQAVDLVDEQHVARLQVGQQRREVAGALDHRARGGAEPDPHLARDDLRQGGLAEPRRAGKQHMVERLAAGLGRLDEDAADCRAAGAGRRTRRGSAAASSASAASASASSGSTMRRSPSLIAASLHGPCASSCSPARISASAAAAAPSRCAAAATAPNASARR